MTELQDMTQERWSDLTEEQRRNARDPSGLTQQLIGLEGWRVEVETIYGGTRRFIVGRSTGWRPCHLEIHNRRSLGGGCAEPAYRSVKRLYQARR